MPVRGAVAAMRGTACYVQNTPAASHVSGLLHVQNCMAAKGRGGSQVYCHRAFPIIEPLVVAGIEGVCLKHAGVVDQRIDAAIKLFQRAVPQSYRRVAVAKVAIDAGQPDNARAAFDKDRFDGFADTPACTGQQYMEGFVSHSDGLRPPNHNFEQKPLVLSQR